MERDGRRVRRRSGLSDGAGFAGAGWGAGASFASFGAGSAGFIAAAACCAGAGGVGGVAAFTTGSVAGCAGAGGCGAGAVAATGAGVGAEVPGCTGVRGVSGWSAFPPAPVVSRRATFTGSLVTAISLCCPPLGELITPRPNSKPVQNKSPAPATDMRTMAKRDCMVRPEFWKCQAGNAKAGRPVPRRRGRTVRITAK